MSRGRAALVNVVTWLVLALVVGFGVWLAGGPGWAAWEFGAVTYLSEVKHPQSPAVREGLGRRP